MQASELITITQPASGSIAAKVADEGQNGFRITLTLTAFQVAVTDAAGSGSYGSAVISTLAHDVIITQCKQTYSAFTEGSALTGGNDDAVFDIGIGSVAKSSAADGALTTTDDDIGDEIAVNLASTTLPVEKLDVASDIIDVSAAATINLNWSGSATTIDANSTIDVTGVIEMVVKLI